MGSIKDIPAEVRWEIAAKAASENKEMQEFPIKAIFPMLGVMTTTEELVIDLE